MVFVAETASESQKGVISSDDSVMAVQQLLLLEAAQLLLEAAAEDLCSALDSCDVTKPSRFSMRHSKVMPSCALLRATCLNACVTYSLDHHLAEGAPQCLVRVRAETDLFTSVSGAT